MSTSDIHGSPCPVCNVGRLERGTRTVTIERGDSIVVIKEVPGWVCASCGEGYSDEETTSQILDIADAAFERGAEVEILAYRKPRAA